jgi:hypothetical protein
MGEVIWGLLGSVSLVCVLVYFCCCGGECLCQGLQGAGVGTIDWSEGGECVVGRGSVITGWGKLMSPFFARC